MSRSLSQTAARIRPPVFSELQARIDRLAASGQEIVPLQIGDTHLLPPAGARQALAQIDGADASLYRYGATAGLAPLREAFANRLRAQGREVDPASEIHVGNGGTHALFCAARALLDDGDEVLLASPWWPLAPGIFTTCGAINVEVPLMQRLYDDPGLDVAAAFAAKITPRTKAIYFISPNNPDGKVLGRRELEAIASVAKEHDLWVFADEVYADTLFDGREHLSIATLPGMRERTVTLHSLSKSHALAGLRIGFVAAEGAIIAAARRVSTHSAFNVSVAMQRAAIAALADDEFSRKARDDYQRARDAAARALEDAPVRFHVADGATYLFVDFGKPVLPILERAVERGVLLAPGDAFGSYGTFARLCFTAVPIDVVVRGIERLREALVT
jgi:aspartate/methionine/tyrosine aminotransferase